MAFWREEDASSGLACLVEAGVEIREDGQGCSTAPRTCISANGSWGRGRGIVAKQLQAVGSEALARRIMEHLRGAFGS
jgi:hypothetical protein